MADDTLKYTQQIPYFKCNECASFVLRTNDAVSDTYLTSHTWKNINLRTLIGNVMYDKYDTFILKPIFISSAYYLTPAPGSNLEDRMLVFNIQGLAFANNYNSTTLTKTASCVFNTLVLRVTLQTSINGGIPLTFKKYQELVDLTIFLSRVAKNGNGNYQVQTTNPYPHFVLSFQIYGVEKEGEDDITKKISM